MFGRRGWLGAGMTVLVLGAIGIIAIWQSLSQSTNPDYQIRNERAGIGEYFVNLWIDPHPARAGETEVSVQLTSIIGTALEPSDLSVALNSPGGEPVHLDLAHRMGGGAQDHVYTANTLLESGGLWEVTVQYSFGGPQRSEVFLVDVAAE
jgi:hypothetical protein